MAKRAMPTETEATTHVGAERRPAEDGPPAGATRTFKAHPVKGHTLKGRTIKGETVEDEAVKGGASSSTGRHGRAGRWSRAGRHAVTGFRRDGLTDRAAALTYYSVLSIFPALLVLVALLGLFGQHAIQSVLDTVGKVAPGQVNQVLTTALGNLRHSQTTAGALAIIGLLAAVWSASSYVAAFMRASAVVHGVKEERPGWRLLPVRLGVTVVLLVLLLAGSLLIVFSGGLANQVGHALGLGSTGITVWNVAKWPVLLLIVVVIFAMLYWAAPSSRTGGFRWITPGSTLGVLIWVAASVGFGFYVGHFGSYNKTYGALAGVVIFLIWLWLSNLAILFGAELDAGLHPGAARGADSTSARAAERH
jgi:membrane protein